MLVRSVASSSAVGSPKSLSHTLAVGASANLRRARAKAFTSGKRSSGSRDSARTTASSKPDGRSGSSALGTTTGAYRMASRSSRVSLLWKGRCAVTIS